MKRSWNNKHVSLAEGPMSHLGVNHLAVLSCSHAHDWPLNRVLHALQLSRQSGLLVHVNRQPMAAGIYSAVGTGAYLTWSQ